MCAAASQSRAIHPQLLRTLFPSRTSKNRTCKSRILTLIQNTELNPFSFVTLTRKRVGGPTPSLHCSLPPRFLTSLPPCLRPASMPPLTPCHPPRLESVRERNPQNRSANRPRRQAPEAHPSRLHPVQRNVHRHTRPHRRQAVSQLPQGLSRSALLFHPLRVVSQRSAHD